MLASFRRLVRNTRGQQVYKVIMDNLTNNSDSPPFLYLENVTVLSPILQLVMFIFYSGWGVLVPLAILGIAYCTCETSTIYHTARCSYCAEPTPRRTGCKETRFRWTTQYCSVIEWLTVTLLVDIFRTPHLEKEIQDGKRYLRVGKKKFSLQIKRKVIGTGCLFYSTMGLVLLLSNKDYSRLVHQVHSNVHQQR